MSSPAPPAQRGGRAEPRGDPDLPQDQRRAARGPGLHHGAWAFSGSPAWTSRVRPPTVHRGLHGICAPSVTAAPRSSTAEGEKQSQILTAEGCSARPPSSPPRATPRPPSCAPDGEAQAIARRSTRPPRQAHAQKLLAYQVHPDAAQGGGGHGQQGLDDPRQLSTALRGRGPTRPGAPCTPPRTTRGGRGRGPPAACSRTSRSSRTRR
ncbi:hypothetical protein QJS66_04390 [Kocuria rhizophila]|nr:hypothetical protein QJS66_04390 [Kocuria rhizophila]